MKKLNNKKMCIYTPEGAPLPRVYRRKERGKKSARILVKCGDCEHKIEVYPDCDITPGMIEIGGVLAHRDHWKQIFEEAGIL